MPIVNKKVEITEEEAVNLLRNHLDNMPKKDSKFKVGDAVMLDTGWIGVVDEVTSEGQSCIYINDNGDIAGPAYGYDLTPMSKFNKEH